jgi:hypothetical protein
MKALSIEKGISFAFRRSMYDLENSSLYFTKAGSS